MLNKFAVFLKLECWVVSSKTRIDQDAKLENRSEGRKTPEFPSFGRWMAVK
jgi:hypothetical protein